jgi:lysozyme
MSRDFEREYLKDHPLNYPRWTQLLQGKPDLEGRTWMFWQYTVSGSLNGIRGQIDKNVFVGKRIQFDQMLCPPIQTTQQKVSDP